MNENLFWMIWIAALIKSEGIPGHTYLEFKGKPTRQHCTVDEARLEAERLLKLPENRGKRAYILEAQSYGEIEASPVVWRTV